jgi:hypothetical protein
MNKGRFSPSASMNSVVNPSLVRTGLEACFKLSMDVRVTFRSDLMSVFFASNIAPSLFLIVDCAFSLSNFA